LRVKLYITV